MRRLAAIALVLTLATGVAACGSSGSDTQRGSGTTVPDCTGAKTASFRTQGGIGFVAVQGATPGTKLTLVDLGGSGVDTGTVDRMGSLVFRDTDQGATFTVRGRVAGSTVCSKPVRTLRFGSNPPQSFYDRQPEITNGYQYLTTRDGTSLAIMVRPPLGKSWSQGPFPVLINMSGYADADPDSPTPMGLISSAFGFATVSVSERGAGCSGGISGLFDETWAADGYDVVETIAAQPWATAVGLTGISFPGITQLFTSATNPPHLAAATPMSVMADAYRSPAYPGGIWNNGFTETWLTDRKNDSEPAPGGGQGYATKQIEAGDKVCAENQKLRLQTLDPIEVTNSNEFRDPNLIDRRSAINYVSRIKVPLLLSGAWQDEQVGSDFANLFDELPRRDDVKAVLTNGVHSAPLEPELLTQWVAFVQIFVAKKVPDFAILNAIENQIAAGAQGGDADIPPIPDNPYKNDKTVAEAKARYLALPRYRILFDNGGDPAQPGLPGGGYVQGFDTWPPTETTPTRWYFGADGKLEIDKPGASDAADEYRPDSTARPMQTIPGQGQSESWVLLPDYDWRPLVDGTAVAYQSPQLVNDTAMVGTGSVDLWVKSTAKDADLQVTLTEIRPDGKETYVQNGWLRASHRALDPDRTTVVNPWPTHLASQAAPLPSGRYSKVRVAIFPVGHVFRKGSRIRISVSAPGGDRTRWSFRTKTPPPGTMVWIGRSRAYPSSIVLPLTDVVRPTTPTPPCPGLRGQPCRPYRPASNGG